jgi:hypothetical protein
MKSISIGEWSEYKTKELFSIPHQILDIVKGISEYSTKEMQILVNHSLEQAKHGANNDFKTIEKLQTKAVIETSIRISEYRASIKSQLINAYKDISEQSADRVVKSMESLADWIEHNDNKMPEFNEELGSVVREMSKASMVAFKESQKLLISTIDNADMAFNRIDKRAY